MSVYARLSFADVLELRADLVLGKRFLDGYLNVVGYLQRFGSLPANEQALASVVGCTVRYLREVAWPLLADRLAQSDDGQRYYDPEITANRPSRRAAAPTAAAKSPQQQAAAHARWRNRRGEAHPPADAQAHAEPMRTHAETHGDSMRDASETHPVGASADAADASVASASRASPSLASSLLSSSQPPERKQESKEEGLGGGPRAGASEADAPHASDDATSDAPRIQTDAQSDAPAHANGHAKPAGKPPKYTLLSDDFRPRPEAVAELQALGHDPDHVADKFRLLCRSRGKRSKDWDAEFRLFYLKEDQHQPAQRGMIMGVKGGKAADVNELRARLAARFGDNQVSGSGADDDGPIIQGVAL